MKLPLLCLLSVALISCSNPESGFLIERQTSKIEERPLVSSSEIAKEELKDSARNLVLGKSSEEAVVSKFSAFFKVGIGEEELFKNKADFDGYMAQVEAETAGLNNELMLIFNEKIETYLTLLNASIAQKNINPVKIKLDPNNPKSAQDALNSLYSSLRSRAKELSLREQYMIFQLTEFFIQKYRSENIENIVPRDSVAKFVETLIVNGKDKPQNTFRKYQVVGGFLSDGELLSVFKPILAKVTIDKKSNYNEVELFRKVSYFSVAQKYTEFIETSAEAKTYFQSLNYASALLVKNIPGKDSEAPNFFRSINLTIQSSQSYLGKVASENAMSIQEISELQDSYYKNYYLPLVESFDNKPARYKQFLESSSAATPTFVLELMLASFQSESKKIDFNALTLKFNESLNEFKVVSDDQIRKYMYEYQLAVNGNLILSINAKLNPEVSKKNTDMYAIFERSKDAVKSALVMRNSAEVISTSKILETESEIILLNAGIYKGNLKTAKKLVLHPLTVIIPEGDSLVVEAQSLIGGRIDGSFQVVDSNEVKNRNEGISVSTGSRPVQNGYNFKNTPNPREKCGAREKDCWEKTSMGGSVTFSRYVSEGSIPGKEKSGVAGINGKTIELKISKNSISDSLVVSAGFKGFKGRQGINSPLCNSVNEYVPYMGVHYSASCNYPSVVSECNGAINSHENSRTVFHVLSGASGDGGIGGRGGDITITFLENSATKKFPALTIGGPGGNTGDRAKCIAVGQSSNLYGGTGPSGENGRVVIK